MTRSALFNLMIVVLCLCMGIAGLLWWYVQQVEVRLLDLQGQFAAKQVELSNLNQITEAQAKLDSLTLDEKSTSQLELLRHLGLEKMKINFSVSSREARPVGDTSLITRVVQMNLNQPYIDQIEFINQLYAKGKLHLGRITLTKVQQESNEDMVGLQLEGTLYSLEKQGEAPVVEPVAVPANPEPVMPPSGTTVAGEGAP